MNPVIDFMCSDAGQLLTVAVLFAALALNLLAFALRLFELFRRPETGTGQTASPGADAPMMRRTTGRNWNHDQTMGWRPLV